MPLRAVGTTAGTEDDFLEQGLVVEGGLYYMGSCCTTCCSSSDAVWFGDSGAVICSWLGSRISIVSKGYSYSEG
jgi:hypothetical protein